MHYASSTSLVVAAIPVSVRSSPAVRPLLAVIPAYLAHVAFLVAVAVFAALTLAPLVAAFAGVASAACVALAIPVRPRWWRWGWWRRRRKCTVVAVLVGLPIMRLLATACTAGTAFIVVLLNARALGVVVAVAPTAVVVR